MDKQTQLPISLETEKAAMGSMLLDTGAAVLGCSLLRPDDFYDRKNRMIFAVCQELISEGGQADITLIWRRLEEKQQAASIGLDYLAELSCTVGSSVNLAHYAKELKGLSYFRRSIETGKRILMAGYKQDALGVTQGVEEIRRDGIGASLPQTANVIMARHVAEMARKRDSGQVFSGLRTGFIDLDLILGGLRPGDLYILAGRPAMGKTALAIDIARAGSKHLLQEGKVVVFFSLEMSDSGIVSRMYSGEHKTDNVFFSLREKDDLKWAEFLRSIERNGDQFDTMAGNIYVDDSGSMSPDDIREKCHGISLLGKGIGLVVIDYLQLMHGVGKTENRVQEVSFISRRMKMLAKDLGCPVVALSQLSRRVEERPDKRPMLSDLRESGSIEQDADAVLFVYRDEYYFPDTEKPGQGEIIIAKQRNGPTGTVSLAWIPSATTFRNLADEDVIPGGMGFHVVKTKSPWDGGKK